MREHLQFPPPFSSARTHILGLRWEFIKENKKVRKQENTLSTRKVIKKENMLSTKKATNTKRKNFLFSW